MVGVGVPPGLAGAGFGEVGESRANFNRMVKGMTRLKDISENVAGDQLNVEKYVKELSDVRTEMCRATACMFEQEHLRLINMLTATGGGGSKYPRTQVHHGEQGHPELEGCQWRQVLVQAMAPEVHHSTRASWRRT